MFNLHSFFAVRKILKQEKPDVVMTHALKGIGYLTCQAVKSCNIKNIHTLHDVQLSTPTGLILKGEEESWQHNFFGTRLYQSFNRWLLGSPKVVISSSKFLLEFYNQRKFFSKSKKIVLTNPLSIKTQNPINKIQKMNFTFLFLGQIERHKGILLLIDVFKKLLLQTKADDVELMIVGTGSVLAEAKRLAGDEQRIKFLGFVPNNELNKIFATADATVVSSLCYENSPTVIFESLSYGVPVLAARIGGIEFVKDGFNGFTFEAGDAEDLLNILKFSLKNKNKLKQMRANAIESVKEIGVEKYIQKLEGII